MSETRDGYPKTCDLCGEEIGSRIDLDWHGIGTCAPICDACGGSGMESSPEHKISESTVTAGMVELGGLKVSVPFPDGEKVEVVVRERREQQER